MSNRNTYWSATNDYLADNPPPRCPACGEIMFPEDDHGRFICFCRGLGKKASRRDTVMEAAIAEGEIGNEMQEIDINITPKGNVEVKPVGGSDGSQKETG